MQRRVGTRKTSSRHRRVSWLRIVLEQVEGQAIARQAHPARCKLTTPPAGSPVLRGGARRRAIHARRVPGRGVAGRIVRVTTGGGATGRAYTATDEVPRGHAPTTRCMASACRAMLTFSIGLSPPVSTHQRRHAFERVYAEGRWIAVRGDGASARAAGATSVPARAPAALAPRERRRPHGVASLTDVPCGDFCFGGAALSRLRATARPRVRGHRRRALARRPTRPLHSDNRTRFVSLDVASLERLPRPTDLVFSRQMTQHLCNADVAAFLSAVNRPTPSSRCSRPSTSAPASRTPTSGRWSTGRRA